MRTIQDAEESKSSESPQWLKLVEQAVGSLQFGVVQIVVHHGKVVQIETTEKLRLDQSN